MSVRRDERGETIIEVAISVVLMGIVVAAILGGLLALVSISDDHNERTKVATGLQTYIEQFKQPLEELEYIPCGGVNEDGHANYQDALDATAVEGVFEFNDDGFDQFDGLYSATFDVEYWTGSTNSFAPSCSTDSGLQRIQITVANSRTGTAQRSESITIFKRDQTCPPVDAYDNQDAGPC